MILNNIVAWCLDNILALIGIFVGFVALIFGIYAYKKSKREKKPSFSKKSFKIVQKINVSLKGLETKYNGNAVENLTVTNVAFWNDGAKTINRSDLTEADPLRITVKYGYKIFGAKILYISKKANVFNISKVKEKSVIELSFDYLDKGDGGVIQMIHTGKSSDDVDVQGSVKEVKNLCYKFCPSEGYLPGIIPTPAPSKTKGFNYIISFVGLILIAIGVGLILHDRKNLFPSLLVILIAILGIIISCSIERSVFAKYRDIIEEEKIIV